MKLNNESIVCTNKKNLLSINLSTCTHVCRYHKFPSRRKYTNKTLAPKEMCVDLFHSAYPACLSLLYGAKYKNKPIVSCPNPNSNVSIEIKKKPTKTKYLRKAAVWLCSKIGYEIEVPSDELIMVINEDCNSNCLYSYKKGQKFKFNIWLGREVCPATFDALYPSVHNLMRDGNIPWSQINQKNEVVCPDPKSNITMSINKIESL